MFSSFMNPVAIYVGYFFSFSFVFLLPDVNDGNVIANNQVRKQSFSFELIDSSLANSQIHYHRESSSSLVQRLIRESSFT